jgi:hypothetical protein
VFQQPQKCGGAKMHKGREPDCIFAEPEPTKGGEALTVCYALVLHFIIYTMFITKMNFTIIFLAFAISVLFYVLPMA